MENFSIGKQIDKELKEFADEKIPIAVPKRDSSEMVRYARARDDGYYFNQADTIALIDLYYASKFENGQKDKSGNRKAFVNIGKFRSDVSSKQIALASKNFKFFPDEYADPWTAFFMQKDFIEWVKDTNFGALINECEDALPKYGTIVLKKRGKDVDFVNLQTLKCKQNAKSLQESPFVMEEYADMELWEMQAMPDWDTNDLELKYGKTYTVYERYGYVPLTWFKKQKKLAVEEGDAGKVIYVLAFATKTQSSKRPEGWTTLYLEKSDCPYREMHWSRQYGRWLGVGVIEDLFENQIGKNIVANLQRRSLQWAAKRIFQSTTTDVVNKNLVKDVKDGDVLEVGSAGQITRVDIGERDSGSFQTVMNDWDHNADQKAFTYEVATGEALPSGTPFRLGVLLSNATNSYFDKKKESFGLFFKEVIMDFKIPQFIRDMSNQERVISMFDDDAGFEALKSAATSYVKETAIKATLLSGKPVDVHGIAEAVQPFITAKSIMFVVPEGWYKNAKYKFDLTITGEEIDLAARMETLTTLYQVLSQRGDPRAEQVLNRLSAYAGMNLAALGGTTPATPAGAGPAVAAGAPGAAGSMPAPQLAPPSNGSGQ